MFKMEDMIKTIIALDEKARSQVNEAKKRCVAASEDIEKITEEIRAEVSAEIKAAVSSVTEEREREEQRVFAKLDSEDKEITRRLEEMYRENGERWSDAIVEKVLEK